MEIISLINEGMAVLPTLCPSLNHLDVYIYFMGELKSMKIKTSNSKIIKR